MINFGTTGPDVLAPATSVGLTSPEKDTDPGDSIETCPRQPEDLTDLDRWRGDFVQSPPPRRTSSDLGPALLHCASPGGGVETGSPAELRGRRGELGAARTT